MVPRYYLDACCFVAYFADEAERADVVGTLLEFARLGEIELVTSVLTIAEVSSAGPGIDGEAVHAAIAGVLEDSGIVVLADVSRLVARDAQRIVRETRDGALSTIKPLDALHLATATRVGVDAFYTYDEKLWKHGPIDGVVIRAPHVDQIALFLGSEGRLGGDERRDRVARPDAGT